MSNRQSRTAQSARNAGVSIVAQVVVVLLGIVTRTVFVAELGVAMLGINTVLISILAFLAIADLGINGAVMYALYKPLQDGDARTTAAIVRYAGRLFRWVALMVAVLGLALAPFIHIFVRLEDDADHVEVYYLVLLANTVAGYLMLNRLVLLNADQKIYITKTYSLVFNVLRSIAQIVSLLVYGSFLVFLVIQVVFTLLNNVVLFYRAGRLYPFIRNTSASLVDSERRMILRSTRAMVIYRVGGLVLTNSTAVLVSVIVGTVALGYYSNYMLIIGAAAMIVEVVFMALLPSVGNLVAAGSRVARRHVFDEVVLLAILVHGLIAVGFVVLVDDFMVLWLGPDFVLPIEVVVATAFSFYVAGTMTPLWSFRNATGLFRQTQLIMLTAAAVSIALSFTFGLVAGLAGVVVAPAIARLLTMAWYEPWLLIRGHLSGKALPYFWLQTGAIALWSVIAGLTIVLGTLGPSDPLTSMMVEAVIISLLFPVGSWLAFRRTNAFPALVRRLRSLIDRTPRDST